MPGTRGYLPAARAAAKMSDNPCKQTLEPATILTNGHLPVSVAMAGNKLIIQPADLGGPPLIIDLHPDSLENVQLWLSSTDYRMFYKLPKH